MEHISNMEKERKLGPMVPNILANGKMEWLKAMENFIIQTVIFILASLKTTELMGMVSIYIKTDKSMKAIGKMTYKMVLVKKH